MKISKFDFGLGNPKKRFLRFLRIFLRKNGPEIWESRVRRPGNHGGDGTARGARECARLAGSYRGWKLATQHHCACTILTRDSRNRRLTRDSRISGFCFS